MSGAFKFKTEFAIEMSGRDAFELGQRLHAALRLHGFGGFGFKAVDKRLQMLDVRLLLDISGLLLRQTLGALVLVEIVIAAVEREFLIR